jgi:ankyrin repeat protein
MPPKKLQALPAVETKDATRIVDLHAAVGANVIDIVRRLLLEHKAAVNATDSEGNTPLHSAAFKCHADVVRLLLEHKADVKAADSDGDTPLHLAASCGRLDVVRLLLEHKANIKAVARLPRSARLDFQNEARTQADAGAS